MPEETDRDLAELIGSVSGWDRIRRGGLGNDRKRGETPL